MSAPIHRINPTLRLIKCTSFNSIIDVRSPSEFLDDHIPNAINLPVLDDVQRESIGTIYRQKNPFEATAKIPLRVVGTLIVMPECKRMTANNTDSPIRQI